MSESVRQFGIFFSQDVRRDILTMFGGETPGLKTLNKCLVKQLKVFCCVIFSATVMSNRKHILRSPGSCLKQEMLFFSFFRVLPDLQEVG